MRAYWTNIKFLNEDRIIGQIKSDCMNIELLNKYRVTEWM